MAKKSNTSNVQKFSESQNSSSPKNGAKKSGKSRKQSSRSSSGSLWERLTGPKMTIFYGVLLIVFSLLLFMSIVSFYFNAHENVSYVVGDRAQDVPNLAKGVGAMLSYFFIQFFFGVASIGFPLLILL